MARTRLVVSGVPGVAPRVVPLTAAEEAECDKLDAIHPKMKAAATEASARIAALVPGWDLVTVAQVLGSPLATAMLDTPAKRSAAQIARYWRKCKKKFRARATVAAINAVNVSAADPFADGDGWPT